MSEEISNRTRFGLNRPLRTWLRCRITLQRLQGEDIWSGNSPAQSPLKNVSEIMHGELDKMELTNQSKPSSDAYTNA